LPIAKKVKPPVEKLPARKWHPGQLALAMGVIGVLLVLALYFLIGSRLGSNSPQSSSTGSPTNSTSTSSGPAEAPSSSEINPSHSTTATPNPGQETNSQGGGKPTSKDDAGKAGEEKLQILLNELKKEYQKNSFSSATCRRNKEEFHKKSDKVLFENVPFFVCDVLKELESDRTVADFESKRNDAKWCDSIKKLQRVDNSSISKKYTETKPVIDSFQQLLKPNKETLCPTNPTE
jgi:hypothetical protein